MSLESFSRPEDGLRCRQGVKPPLNQPTSWRHRPKAKGWKNICWDFWSFKGHGITKGVFWGQYPEILPRIRDLPQWADCGSWRLGQACLQSGVSVGLLIRVAADIEVFKYCLILTLINVPLRGQRRSQVSLVGGGLTEFQGGGNKPQYLYL